MILFLLAYLGGVLTIVSPCILPVLPFVFARADRPFVRSGLPMLVGHGGDLRRGRHPGGRRRRLGRGGQRVWPPRCRSRCSRCSASRSCSPRLSDRLTRPLVALGARLSQSADQGRPQRDGAPMLPSLLLGVATGLLWAPCAGPVLGLDPDGRRASRAPASAPRCCCWPMPPARRRRWRSPCWSAAGSSPR